MVTGARIVRGGVALVAAVSGLTLAPGAHATCNSWNLVGATRNGAERDVTARDLIELANFGRPDAEPLGEPSPLGLSPDGRFVATVLMRADLDGNDYCQALVLIDLRGQQAPRVLDTGGDFLMGGGVLRGMYLKTGFPALNPARWSADGRSIGYLKRVDGRTQVWRALLDTATAAMVSHAPDDVETWAWGSDGRAIVYRYAVGRAAAEAAIDREGVHGWHFDGRMAPHLDTRPQVAAPLPEQDSGVDPETGAVTAVSDVDHKHLASDGATPLEQHQISRSGLVAWAEHVGPSPYSARRVQALDAHGSALACTGAGCVGRVANLWWDGDGRHLLILTHEGWNHRYTALYRWLPGHDEPRRLLQTDDWIEGCVPAGAILACIRQGATQPPRLVGIAPRTGQQRILFDPNPGFARLRLGRVQRLEWRNATGREIYGDLVLPPDYHGGRLPVIVTQYFSRGFLRGGTGNDYPIQLFALRGFAVLSIQRPDPVAANDPTARTAYEMERANVRDWAERRSIDSAINTGLDLLIARGVGDPARLALTGLSDGASATRFALNNSSRFAAAAISTCCVDESTDDMVGPGWVSESEELGYPPAFPLDETFWKPYSFALSADRVTTPLLMQLANSETLLGMHAYAALKAAGAPVDLYVYPGEFHNRWQPQHRLATFVRDLDWFSFWLQNRIDPSPDKAAQYADWSRLRAGHDKMEPAATSPAGRSHP